MTKSKLFKVAVLMALVATPSVAFAGPASVPEVGSTCSLLGIALTGLILIRSKLH